MTDVPLQSEPSATAMIAIVRRDDSTFDLGKMSPEARWSSYVAAYVKVEPTENVPIEDRFRMPLLRRNLPSDIAEYDERRRPLPHYYEDALEVLICLETYKMKFRGGTSDWFVHSEQHRASRDDGCIDPVRARQIRTAKFRERFGGGTIGDMPEDEVAVATQKLREWLGEPVKSDVEMGGT